MAGYLYTGVLPWLSPVLSLGLHKGFTKAEAEG